MTQKAAAHDLEKRFDAWAGIDMNGRLIANLREMDLFKATHF
jgi:hypothetical protein